MDDLAVALQKRAKQASTVLAFARVAGDVGAMEAARAVLAEILHEADANGVVLDIAADARAVVGNEPSKG
ncbi:hypothetical protein [Catenulispora rubra]|uniref:hypothetical protein n=1 Tax=Catenulispora rubra TaxID=280293 RepID=UPI0018922A5E|nr:hypothetical protein [Catenulispora rubra]